MKLIGFFFSFGSNKRVQYAKQRANAIKDFDGMMN